MRISTMDFYAQGAGNIDAAQSALTATQTQLSTGKKVNVPSDDPLASTEIVQLSDLASQNSQYTSNQTTAQNLLSQTDSTLSSVNNVLTQISTTLVSAGNASLNSSDYGNIATQLEGQMSQLVSLANTQADDGSYLFAGYNASTPAFTQNGSGVTYNGDQGTRTIQIGASESISSTVSGDAVFQRIPTGNGVFATSASSTNSGSASIDTGSITTPSSLTGDTYSINFSVSGGATTYTVTDTTTGTAVAAPSTGANAYTSGDSIEVDGMSVAISGTPDNGDAFSITPSTKQSVFATVQQAINMLKSAAAGSGGTNALGSLQSVIQNVDQAITSVSTVQTQVGISENRLTAAQTLTSSDTTTNTATLASLQDTDMTAAASLLAEQQTVLTAAEDSFAKIANDSLFNYIQG